MTTTTLRFPGRKYNLKFHGDEMPFHPLAAIFPLMGAEEIKALKDDIVKNGLQEPMVTLDGLILDGRNRFLACHGAAYEMGWPDSKVDPPVRFVAYNGDDPLAFVISMNIKRRHLDESQRAMVAANLANMPVGRPKSANLRNITQSQAAALLNISERSVTYAVTVRDRGVPELRRAVESGKLAVATGAQAVKLSPEAQRKFAEMAEAGEAGAAGSLMKKELREGHEKAITHQILALPTKKFGLILADPEWKFVPWSEETGSDRSAANHYATSRLEEIKARDVPSIAADDCCLALWATVPMLPQALEVMAAWGFEYRSHCVWLKSRIATGYWFRNAHELLLIGVKGDMPAPAPGTQWESAWDGESRGHSEKPEEAYVLLETYFPTLPKIELNATSKRDGWDVWGAEAPVEEATAE
jgi:N6-adenosine-specific RNA methylase IME4